MYISIIDKELNDSIKTISCIYIVLIVETHNSLIIVLLVFFIVAYSYPCHTC